MEELSGWEDAIDIDDSDLPSLLSNPIPLSLPSLRSCSQLAIPSQTLNPQPQPPPPRRPIPGPAGAVQSALHRKSTMPAAAAHNPPDDLMADDTDPDPDFTLNPWLSAAPFLDSAPPISSIKPHGTAAARIPQVVGVVTSCVPNGLGDLFVTLKDPTGTIGASVHRKVVESDLGGDISVGCVLILKQVVVFCVSRSACYLNVTPNNVVKIISKDCGPRHKQVLPSVAARCGGTYDGGIGLGAAARTSSLRKISKHTSDETGRKLNYERMVNGEKTVLSGGLQCSFSASVGSREHMEIDPTAERVPLKGQRAVSAADGVRSNLIYDKMINSRDTGEHREVDGVAERLPSVRLRAEAIADEARSNLNYERLINSGKTTGSLPSGIPAAAETTTLAEHLRIGEHMGIETEAAERKHPARLIDGTTTGEIVKKLRCETMANRLQTDLTGNLENTISGSASTTTMAIISSHRTGEDMETEAGVTNGALARHRVECTADDPVRSSSCSVSATTATQDIGPRPDQRTSESKILISKASVAQWTDDQLLELFSDY